MKYDIIKQANKIANAADIKEALDDLKEYYLPQGSEVAKQIYDESMKAGFSEAQSFDMAKSYLLEFCSLQWTEGEEDY